jgi:hypothetical protein
VAAAAARVEAEPRHRHPDFLRRGQRVARGALQQHGRAGLRARRGVEACRNRDLGGRADGEIGNHHRAALERQRARSRARSQERQASRREDQRRPLQRQIARVGDGRVDRPIRPGRVAAIGGERQLRGLDPGL